MTDAPPVFAADGSMMGNLTSSQGQPPAAPPPDAAPASPPWIQKEAAGMEGVQKADEAAMQQRSTQMLKPMSALSNMGPTPQMGQQQKPPPAPDAKDYHKNSMAFASAMAVLGAVAGRFTRMPGNAALNAFAGAINGWQSGNLQAYEEATKKWEADTKTTIENNRQVMEKYKLALDDRKMNIDEQMSQIQLISAQFHDQMMYDAASAKNYTMVAQIYEKNYEWTNGPKGVEASFNKLKEPLEKQRIANQSAAAKWSSLEGQAELNAVNPDGTPKHSVAEKAAIKQLVEMYGGSEGGGVKAPATKDAAMLKFLEENPNASAQEINQFQQAAHPPRSAGAMAVQKFREENPNATADDVQKFIAKQAGMNAGERTGATTASNLDIIMRNAHAAIPMAVQASEKVPRGNWVPLNQLFQTADAKISDPALKEFKIANLQLAELWARAMNPKGVMRESDRSLALEMLSTADSPDTYKRVTQQLANFLERERKSVQEFREGKEPEAIATAPSPTSGTSAQTDPAKMSDDELRKKLGL